jgi:hypothetical protein
MNTSTISRLRLCLLGVVLAALATTASARAASYLQLGASNTSNASTTLTGATAGPELKVVNANGSNHTLLAQSTGGGSGIALYGQHTTAAGAGSAVRADSASTAPAAFSVYGLLTSSTPGFAAAAVRGENRGTTGNSYGIYGSHAGAGVGVEGSSKSGYGVFGASSTGTGAGFSGATGLTATGYATNAWGVHGVANNGAFASGVAGTSTSGAGVYGFSSGGTGQGVSGLSNVTNGTGVIGQANSGASAAGVVGKSASGNGVYGQGVVGGKFSGVTAVVGDSPAVGGTGVLGQANNGTDATGVFGYSATGTGVSGASGALSDDPPNVRPAVSGVATAQGNFFHPAVAIYGKTLFQQFYSHPYDYAGWFVGDVWVTGTCVGCTGASSLQIDDPLDPAHKYLRHAGVASSEQLDLYSGNVVTDRRGFGRVALPRWFQALNGSFRYQLTVVGKTHWDAKAAVWNEIHKNRFTIRTDQPNVKVSWQVTAVRHDPYAVERRASVEVAKRPQEQGTYLHPEAYGKSQRDWIGYEKPESAAPATP